jgi:hypothetical protein
MKKAFASIVIGKSNGSGMECAMRCGSTNESLVKRNGGGLIKGFMNFSRNLLVFLTLLLGNAAIGHAASTLKLVSAGPCVYSLQGSEFNGVAGTDVVIHYDQTALANPIVAWGNLASGYPVANTNTAGQVHIAAVDLNANATSSGTGTFATITFEMVRQSTGNITAQANLIDINGAQLSPVQVSVLSLANTSGASQSSQESDNNAVTSSATGSVSGPVTSTGNGIAPAWLSTVTTSTDGTGLAEKAKEEPIPSFLAPVQEKPAEAVNEEEPQPVNGALIPERLSEKKGSPVNSVIEQFRLYQGEKSPKALMALFKSADGVVQEPPVALSDGNAKVRAIVGRQPSEKQSPIFSLKGAKLVSFRTEGDSAWLIELIPDKGAYKTSITILQDGGIEEIPLMVAPPLPAGSKIGMKGKLTEADFILFLKERGTENVPCFDLNGDGKRDYMDDYIFTANYIVQNSQVKKEKADLQK